MLAVFSGKCCVTVWRPSVCLSRRHNHCDSITRGQHATRPAYILAGR